MIHIQHVTLTLTQESDDAFRIAFDDIRIPSLLADETEPLGSGRGPTPSRLLVASVANCLSASLLFALNKYKNTPATLVARARATLDRNASGRLRVTHLAVGIDLPGPAADDHQLERLLQQFENVCVVTESVRTHSAVDVTVKDASGRILRDSAVADD